MVLKFTKMQGIGNDYIYIDCMKEDIRLSPKQIQKLSERRFGVGSDGVIFIRPSKVADGAMDMYNADGSRGLMCGNGVRCVGKYLYDNGYAKKDTVTVETASGVKTLAMKTENGVCVGAAVDMGEAALECADVPVKYDGGNVDVPVVIGGGTYRATCVSMGNPHAVVFVDEPESLELETLGPEFENHPLFPERVNTEFVKVAGSTRLEMRVWERGSGETLACGTGACAAAVAAVLKGYCHRNSDITVKLRGGELIINYGLDGRVTMTGACETVYEGRAEIREC